MSDFFYSPQRRSQEDLKNAFRVISKSAADDLHLFEGEWGSLAVGRSPYLGYEPYEDDRHICVVIGGPVLYFRDNHFFNSSEKNEGTRSLLMRWRDSSIQWDEDLSGPFVVLIVDKHCGEVVCITDLMLFIPVLIYGSGKDLAIASHIDMLAVLCKQRRAYDPVSLVDFVLHGWVTYPHTAYKAIYQAQPASIYRWNVNNRLTTSVYWEPQQTEKFSNLDEAAHYLREGLTGYVERVTASMDHVAHFITGGEDSRVLAGVLPARLKRDAYIFLDHMNREGRIAKGVAQVYGANFCVGFRSRSHYVDILPEAAELCGSGFQYRHAHSFGFHDRYKLRDYPAVFGGYFSDNLLKGFCVRTLSINQRFDFLPQWPVPSAAEMPAVSHPLFSSNVLNEITNRRRAHWARADKVESDNRDQWFAIWPSTMRSSITNIHVNRRLFASFEPFLCKEAVKVCAAVPVQWKLNRRLFWRAFRSALCPSRWHRHADGRFPFFPWWVNFPIHFGTSLFRAVARRLKISTSYQGPWCDWNALGRSPEYKTAFARLGATLHQRDEITDVLLPCFAQAQHLSIIQKVNLMQALHLFQVAEEFAEAPTEKHHLDTEEIQRVRNIDR